MKFVAMYNFITSYDVSTSRSLGIPKNSPIMKIVYNLKQQLKLNFDSDNHFPKKNQQELCQGQFSCRLVLLKLLINT